MPLATHLIKAEIENLFRDQILEELKIKKHLASNLRTSKCLVLVSTTMFTSRLERYS